MLRHKLLVSSQPTVTLTQFLLQEFLPVLKMLVSCKFLFYFIFLLLSGLVMVSLIHAQSFSISVFLTAKSKSVLQIEFYSFSSLYHLIHHLCGEFKEGKGCYASGQQEWPGLFGAERDVYHSAHLQTPFYTSILMYHSHPIFTSFAGFILLT